MEGRRIRLHVSPTCIMSEEMRGEQGPGLLHVGDGGRKGVVRVWVSDLQRASGFFLCEYNISVHAFHVWGLPMDLPFMVRHPSYSTL